MYRSGADAIRGDPSRLANPAPQLEGSGRSVLVVDDQRATVGPRLAHGRTQVLGHGSGVDDLAAAQGLALDPAERVQAAERSLGRRRLRLALRKGEDGVASAIRLRVRGPGLGPHGQ